MKKLIGLLAAWAVLFSACNIGGTKDGENADSLKTAEIQLPVFTIAEFDSLAATYVDKEIQVKGLVEHVCRHGGKRLLLVDDESSLHVDWTDRFSDSLAGHHIIVNGIVREFRVDEAYCLQQEKDNIMKHREGQSDKESFEHKKNQIAGYREDMKTLGVDHLSFYTLDYLTHKVE